MNAKQLRDNARRLQVNAQDYRTQAQCHAQSATGLMGNGDLNIDLMKEESYAI